MAILQAQKSLPKLMTEEEFMRLPDNGRKYELVDGEARVVPASFQHDIIGMTVGSLLRPAAKGRGYIAGAQAGFRMTSANIRCPDISFTRKEHYPDGVPSNAFGSVAPDLCIEIISPSENRADLERKLREYFDSGAEQVWRMYPETETIEIFSSPTNFHVLSSEDEIDARELLPDFRCRVGDLFALE